MAGNKTGPRLVGPAPEAMAAIADGCSGKLTALYLFMWQRDISCRYCCDEHDLAYEEGGGAQERKQADIRLRQCAAVAGKFPSGLHGRARRVWRKARAWAMYAAVRLFGWIYWRSD